MHQLQPEPQKSGTEGLDEATGMSTARPRSVITAQPLRKPRIKKQNSQILMVLRHQQLPAKSSSKAGLLRNDIK